MYCSRGAIGLCHFASIKRQIIKFFSLSFMLFGCWLDAAYGMTDCDVVTEIPVTECQALLELYNNTDGPNWRDEDSVVPVGWNDTNTPCSWTGVTCENGQVTELALIGVNLNGSLPDLNLPALIELNLRANQLSGGIPDFSNLPMLEVLDLVSNQLSGDIPNFSHLPQLTALLLGFNQFSGVIPDFNNLAALRVLFLRSNELSGAIPDFSNLPVLERLILDWNPLDGTLFEFSNLPALSVLFLNDVGLRGPLLDFSNLPSLISLDLGSNQLTGTIPDFNHLPALEYLSLTDNELSGTIPDFSHLPFLTTLNLGFNQLNSTIPDFNHLPVLENLSLNNNQLNGAIPNFSNLPMLEVLDLNFNRLSSTIPDFNNLPLLNTLGLGYNELSGNIPGFSALPELFNLEMTFNNLEGAVPEFTAFSLADINIELNNNCNLTASSPTQEAVLNQQDETWQTVSPFCNVSLFDVTLATTVTGSGFVSGFGSYPIGFNVTLEAVPNPGSVFSGWSPASCTESFVMPDSHVNCTAEFSQVAPNNAQCAVYTADPIPNVAIPCLDILGTTYRVNMQVLTDTASNTLSFAVDLNALARLGITPGEQCAAYPFGPEERLRLNCVEVNGELFQAELAQVPNPAAIQFDLIDASTQ